MKTYKAGQPPEDPAALPGFLRTETAAIEQAAHRAEPFTEMQVLSVAPTRLRAGMYVTVGATLGASTADGFGSGQGQYRRNEANTAWVYCPSAPASYGWRDILGEINPKTTGANTPLLAVYAGGNIREMAFVANDLIDLDFHIPHDYVPGTNLYVHVHWSHNGTSISGNAVFDVYSQYAKGHNQANFSAEKNVTITYATTDITTTPRYRHRLDEVQLSSVGGSASLLDTSAIEPDGIVLMQVKLTTLPTIGGGGSLFIHTVDLHYQSTNVATLNKAPNFYA